MVATIYSLIYTSQIPAIKNVIRFYVFIPDVEKTSTKTGITNLGNLQCTTSIIWF